MTVDSAIARIVAYVDHRQWSTLRLSQEAGVPESTLRGWRDPGWSPRVSTLHRLESVVPSDWAVSDTEAA